MPSGCPALSQPVFLPGLAQLTLPDKSTQPPLPGLLLPPLLPISPPDIPCLPFTFAGVSGAPSFSVRPDAAIELRFTRYAEADSPCGFQLTGNIKLPYMPISSNVSAAAAFANIPAPVFDVATLGLNGLGKLELRLGLKLPTPTVPTAPTSGQPSIDIQNLFVNCGNPFEIAASSTPNSLLLQLRIPPISIQVTGTFSESFKEFNLTKTCVDPIYYPEFDAYGAGHILIKLEKPHNVYDIKTVDLFGNSPSPGVNEWFMTVRHADGLPGNPPAEVAGDGGTYRYIHCLSMNVPHYFCRHTYPHVTLNLGGVPSLEVDTLVGGTHVPVELKFPVGNGISRFEYVYGLTADTVALYCKKARARLKYGVVYNISVLPLQLIAPFDSCA